MWIAENWKDYEVLDTSKDWNAGEIILWFVRTRRLSGILRKH